MFNFFTILPDILKYLAFPLLAWWFERKATNEKGKREYITFLEIMARKGKVSANYRLNAYKQMERVNEAWEKEKAEK